MIICLLLLLLAWAADWLWRCGTGRPVPCELYLLRHNSQGKNKLLVSGLAFSDP